MSITRRQFLLSTAGAAAGAIIPAFYYRALSFFEQHGEPLLQPPEHFTEELIVADINGYPELSLGDPYDEPPELTFREYAARYGEQGIENYRKHFWSLPETPDKPMDWEQLAVLWSLYDGPAARAHHYLQSLDLGPSLSGPDAVGGLDFITETNMGGWPWRVVRADDPVTLSLLQRRLNDLGSGIRVVCY